MQLDLFPDAVHLQSVNPACNRARFYTMDVVRDLFGEWVLMKRWGRIGTTGRCSMSMFGSQAAAVSALGEAARVKGRRGYILKDEAGV